MGSEPRIESSSSEQKRTLEAWALIRLNFKNQNNERLITSNYQLPSPYLFDAGSRQNIRDMKREATSTEMWTFIKLLCVKTAEGNLIPQLIWQQANARIQS